MQLEYESYIEKTYPNWKDKLMLQRNQQLVSLICLFLLILSYLL